MVAKQVWWRIGVMVCSLWYVLAGSSWGQEVVLVDFTKAQNAVPQGWELSVKAGTPSSGSSQTLQDRLCTCGASKRRLPCSGKSACSYRIILS